MITTAVITIIFAVLAISLLLLAAGMILTFLSNRYAVAVSYAGLFGIGMSIHELPCNSLIFWGVAAGIVIVIQCLLPKNIAKSTRGVGYIAGATLAGTFVGLAISHEWMIVGAVAGAILGGIAYSRTPAGSVMEFPSSKFLNYLCAKGLPAVISSCIVGTAILWLTAILSEMSASPLINP
ncbi:MAG: hypothetical protein K2G41_08315 [Duncaniella sp.]|uniref:hypothetical protein n=1 Tax=Duncaniella sp. TaxID=2518496 RepID=UPI0023D41C5B|nr:hypothetical protein [Duncaniella sp.]MDE6090692.1 hypothetical protein [Duncaniella sp.]